MGLARLQFGEFELDCDRYELRRDGRSVKIEKLPLDLLILLAENSDRLVTRGEIVERLWGAEVFVDSEHGINTAVRKVRQTLRDDPESPRFIQTVTGRGYRFVASVTVTGRPAASKNGNLSGVSLGDPVSAPTLVSFNPNNDQVGTDSSSEPLLNRRLRWWIWATALGILVTIAIGVVLHRWRDRSEDRSTMPRVATLAVLPLNNLSGYPGQEYFADGMTDELITMLAKNSTLRVISRTSAMQYKGAHRPLREIAEKMGADGIVEGSIEKTGSRIHMTVQLIRAPSDTHLWAESHDRDVSETSSLAGDAARSIALSLHSGTTEVVVPKHIRPEAHDAYLRGQYYWFNGLYKES